MSRVRTVVLDSEAVQALLDPRSRKHRRALAVVEAVAARNLRRAGMVRLVVPTSVRVEAGWNRQAPGAATINRLRVDDAALDARAADRAVPVRADLGVSVSDAHLAAVVATTAGAHAVITSDVHDLRAIAGTSPRRSPSSHSRVGAPPAVLLMAGQALGQVAAGRRAAGPPAAVVDAGERELQ